MVVRRRIAVAFLCATLGMLVGSQVRAASRNAEVVGVGVVNDVAARTLDGALA